METADAATRFNAAFPWFDHTRWAWHYESVPEGGSAYRIPGAPPNAFGEIAIYMHGADADQFAAVRAWLTREFNPARRVPATGETWRIRGQSRVGGHGNTLPGSLR